MRELKRSIAKANMRAAGITQLFKPSKNDGRSKFARGWREFVIDATNPDRKTRAALRKSARKLRTA